MTRQAFIYALSVGGIVTACASCTGPGLCASLSTRQLRSIAQGVIDADNARDLDAVLGYYCQNAIWMPPDRPDVPGRSTIEMFYRSMYELYVPSLSTTVDEVLVSGDLGVLRGTVEGSLQNERAGAKTDVYDKYLMIFQRVGGRWCITHLMWSESEDVPKSRKD